MDLEPSAKAKSSVDASSPISPTASAPTGISHTSDVVTPLTASASTMSASTNISDPTLSSPSPLSSSTSTAAGSSTSTSRTMASSKLFDTTELAEAVFLQLPPRDVLLNGRVVCSTWRSIIDSSPALKWHTFLGPEPCGPVVYEPPTPEGRHSRCSAPCGRRCTAYYGRLVKPPHTSISPESIELNDTYAPKIRVERFSGEYWMWTWGIWFKQYHEDDPFFAESNEAVRWRSMQLSKPPVFRAEISLHIDSEEGDRLNLSWRDWECLYPTMKLDNEDGITMGQLYDELTTLRCLSSSCSHPYIAKNYLGICTAFLEVKGESD